MNAKKKTRKVCIALNIGGASGRAYLSGILRYVSEGRPWTIQFLQFSELLPIASFRNALKSNLDGLILRSPSSAIADIALRERTLPVAFIDLPVRPAKPPQQNNITYLHLDDQSIGASAAAHLTSIGRFASFGYADVYSPSRWGTDRGTGFAKAVRRAGNRVSIIRPGRNSNLGDDTRLRDWLAALPKPAAVMGSCDYTAVRVIETCRELGLSVPEQVAVIGVDDDEMLCHSIRPSLSSINPNHEAVGYRAAAELDRMMRGRTVPSDIMFKGSGTVVVRDSTRTVPPAGALVSRALAFIDANAGRRIGVEDVVRCLGVSRRLADLRFRQIRKSSILDAICDARMRKLKTRLRATDDSIRQIAANFGFSSPERLAHFFRRHAGQSMRDYRNSLK